MAAPRRLASSVGLQYAPLIDNHRVRRERRSAALGWRRLLDSSQLLHVTGKRRPGPQQQHCWYFLGGFVGVVPKNSFVLLRVTRCCPHCRVVVNIFPTPCSYEATLPSGAPRRLPLRNVTTTTTWCWTPLSQITVTSHIWHDAVVQRRRTAPGRRHSEK